MTSGTPISRPVQPRFGAGSGLQSPLGNDDLTNQWKKTKVPSSSTFGLAVAVARMERMLAQLRRRVLTPPNTSTSTTSGGLNNRGLWTSGTTYNFNDLVQVQTGVATGGYISTIDGNNNDPATGIGWMQWPVSQQAGQWT